MTENTEHLDPLTLDLLRTGEASAADRAHLDGCPQCREELVAARRFASDFQDLASVGRAPAPEIPESVEARIRWNARKSAARVRRRGLRLPAARRWAVAAAVVLLAGISTLGVLEDEGPESIVAPSLAPSMSASPATEELSARVFADEADGSGSFDVNGDGRLDILDAFALARALEAGETSRGGWDFNADRIVDGKDADALAMRAVAIGARG